MQTVAVEDFHTTFVGKQKKKEETLNVYIQDKVQ